MSDDNAIADEFLWDLKNRCLIDPEDEAWIKVLVLRLIKKVRKP